MNRTEVARREAEPAELAGAVCDARGGEVGEGRVMERRER